MFLHYFRMKENNGGRIRWKGSMLQGRHCFDYATLYGEQGGRFPDLSRKSDMTI